MRIRLRFAPLVFVLCVAALILGVSVIPIGLKIIMARSNEPLSGTEAELLTVEPLYSQELYSISFDPVLSRPIPLRRWRGKRQVRTRDSKRYSWHFNLNVTRHENATDPIPSASKANQKEAERDYLGMSVYMEGRGQKRTMNELQKSWNSVAAFAKGVFGVEGRSDPVVNDQIVSVEGSVVGDLNAEAVTTFDGIVIEETGKSSNSSQPTRAPRFIFNLLGFGGRSTTAEPQPVVSDAAVKLASSPPVTESHGTEKNLRLGTESTVADDPRTEEIAIQTMISNALGTQRSIETDDGIPKQELNTDLIDETLLFESNSLNHEQDSAVILMKNDSNVPDSELAFGTTEAVDECDDCLADLDEPQPNVDSLKEPALEESISNAKRLESFCMNLVNQLEDSHVDSRSLAAGGKFENGFSSSPLNNSDASNSPPSLVETLTDSINFAENSDFMSESRNQTERSLDIGQRLDDFLQKEKSSVGKANDSEEMLHTVRDCASFFRSSPNGVMFPKPNLMDMISDPNIKLDDFSNATVSQKLQEQNVQFLTNLLHVLDQSDKSEPNGINEPGSNEASPDINHEESIHMRRLENDPFPVTSDLDRKSTSNEQDMGVFNVRGSGDGEESSNEDARFFFNSFFGSGDGRLFNNEDNLLDTSTLDQSTFGEAPNDDGRLFSWFNAGSGAGRQISEELNPTEPNEKEFENDCFTGVGNDSHECNPENVEDSLDHEAIPESNGYDQSYGEGKDLVRNLNISNVMYEESGAQYVHDDNDMNPASKQEGNDVAFDAGSGDDGRNLNEDFHITLTESHHVCNDCEDVDLTSIQSGIEYDTSSNETDCLDDCSDLEESNIPEPSNQELYRNLITTLESSSLNETDCLDDCSDLESAETADFSIPNLEIDDSCNDCDEVELTSVQPSIDHTTNVNEIDCPDCSDLEDAEIVDSITSDQDLEGSLDEHNGSCNDCFEVELTSLPPVTDHVPNLNETDCSDDCSDLGEKEESNVPGPSNQDLYRNFGTTLESFSKLETEDSNRTDERIIFNPIFLTGSGDGGFIEGDNPDPINLIEEDTVRPTMPPRRSRKLDLDDLDYESMSVTDQSRNLTNLVEDAVRPTLPPRRSRKLDLDVPDYDSMSATEPPGILTSSISDPSDLTSAKSATSAEAAIEVPRRRGRMEDFDFFDYESENIPNSVSNEYDPQIRVSDLMIGPRPRPEAQPATIPVVRVTLPSRPEAQPATIPVVRVTLPSRPEAQPATIPVVRVTLPSSLTSEASTLSSTLATSPQSSSFPVTLPPNSTVSVAATTLKARNLEPKPCHSASECSFELNERCVRKGPSSVCDCLEPLIRQVATGICVAKVPMDVSLRFPWEQFDEDLRNPESQRFKMMETNALNTLALLLQGNSELIPVVADLNVIGFRPGSLIVDATLVLAARNKSESELVRFVENELEAALNNHSLIQQLPLNAKDALLQSVTTPIDPCESPDMNYCSTYAHCIRNSTFPGGYTCLCKDDYSETSDYMLPGEVCEIYCPDDFCGENGHCEITSEGIICLCKGWYFGGNCEISGVVVVATFSSNLALLVIVTFLLILCKNRYCRSRSYGGNRRSEEDGMTRSNTTGRISEEIAMSQNPGIRVARFEALGSTPLPDRLPTIKVTHPTLNDSSISIDIDSSFASDRSRKTPSNDLTSPIYSEVPA